ncbi:MAG: gliding motility-associated C-terminal domain-containing protein [Cyclobacteriaceae bacterium]|nr:gliding motility-associated C-terminal domain-containing protein [Cyclobacteriaceae bacterium]
MAKRLFLFFFLLLSSFSFGSHIVGGEFELLHIAGNTYRLNVIIYFDVVNGNPGAIDQQITARIFRKSNNSHVSFVTVPIISQQRVDYFQPDCSTGEVVTDRILYTTTITLDSSEYNDPEGYYIAWERCCRNYFIKNIKSVDVGTNPDTPDYAGQTFYLEFPPVVDEKGEPFINSSPQLFPPLNDYACPNRPYWVDFAGTDIDGDSLVYTLVTPLNTHAAVAVVQDPISGVMLGANPGPYPGVKWESGYSLDNILGGMPDLSISEDGFLSVTPTSQGLYVFAVLCEEYREGKKIGEVRRDFQMLVVDQCPIADPPVIKGKRLTDVGFSNANTMDITFPNTILDTERCFQVNVSDLDASKLEDNYSENVYISAIPLNFNEDVGVVLPTNISATLLNGSTEAFDICFPECPFIDPQESNYFELAIVAYDDACALPLTDSLYVRVFIEPPVNNEPYFANTKGSTPFNTISRRVAPTANGNISIDINGWDNDNHNLSMNIIPIDFDLSPAGMSFTAPTFSTGNAQTVFQWNFDCNDASLDFNTGKDVSTPTLISKAFDIMILIEDEDICNFPRTDTLMMNLIIDFPGQTKPTIFKENEPTLELVRIEKKLYETVNFNVIGQDIDNDQILLSAEGAGFNLTDYGATFSNKQGSGNPGITSLFNWDLDCNKYNLAPQDSFRIHFFVEDFDDCELQNQDTLVVDFIISEMPNTKPGISFKSLNNALKIVENNITVNYLQEIEIEITGVDFDNDSISLNLLGVRGTKPVDNHEFNPTKGKSITRSTLFWELDCQFLEDNFDPGLYDFVFVLTDNHCPLNKVDTLALHVKVEDLTLERIDFDPPNVFTPNGDNTNEYFAVDGIDELTNTKIDRGLPEDNCRGQFERITIVNRWGREVFTSNSKDFKWYGNGEATGVYFYNIIYTDKEFKGTISLLR